MPFCEGVNSIQANDLIGGKLAQDGGAAVAALVADMRQTADAAAAAPAADLAEIGRVLTSAPAPPPPTS